MTDKQLFERGNCFKTEAEAEAVAEKVKALLLSLLYNETSINDESLQDKQLPKLTTEVFDRPDCPERAKWATVDEDGTAYFHLFTPMLYADEWQHTRYCRKIPGKWDATNWTEIIQRPEKKTLPDWCKVGEWVWSTTYNEYFKIDRIDDLFFDGESSAGDFYSVKLENIRQARLRPYNADEMRALVGKVIDWESNRELVISYNEAEVEVYVDRMWCNAKYLMNNEYTIDGKPAGAFEHLENGEWVK